jgi:hypothetical protein
MTKRKFFSKSICKIFWVFIFTFPGTAFTQQHTTDIYKAGIWGPGVSAEKSVAQKQTIFLNAQFNPSFTYLWSDNLGSNFDFRLEPALTLQYRFYYNGAKRESKEKLTARNSMNYLAPVYNIVFSKRRLSTSHYEETTMRPIHTFAFSWGLQRNYNNRFSLDFSVGPGLFLTRSSKPDMNGNTVKINYSDFTILSEFNIGFWLNRRVPQTHPTAMW